MRELPWDGDPKRGPVLAAPASLRRGAGPGEMHTALACWRRLMMAMEESFALPVDDWVPVSAFI